MYILLILDNYWCFLSLVTAFIGPDITLQGHLIVTVIIVAVVGISVLKVLDMAAIPDLVIFIFSIGTRIFISVVLIGVSFKRRSISYARLSVAVVIVTQVATILVVNIDCAPVDCWSIVEVGLGRKQGSTAGDNPVSVLKFQSGRDIALVSNFFLHYFFQVVEI